MTAAGSGVAHGAALDAASRWTYEHQAPAGGPATGGGHHHLIHSLVDAIRRQVTPEATAISEAGPEAKMPEVSDLVALKNRLCLREGLNHDECERALLPTSEHASMVHSHIHHLTDQSEEAFVQTRNAIVYISLVVVVYVIVVLWLVSANFRSSLAAMAST